MFSYIKSLLKTYWTAVLALILSVGQIELFWYFEEKAEILMMHTGNMAKVVNDPFLIFIGVILMIFVFGSVTFPTLVIVFQAWELDKLKAKKTVSQKDKSN